MERTHAIREDCPNCGSVAVDTTQVTLYHSVHEGKYVAALEFECPSPTHPQPQTEDGEVNVSLSRFVRHSIDTLDMKYQTPQFKSNVRRVYLQNLYSHEQADPKRHDNVGSLTDRYVNDITDMYLHEETNDHALALAVEDMREQQEIAPVLRRSRLFDRIRDRFKRRGP
jgi:hypothetical protein